MKNITGKSRIAIFILFVFILISGCSDNEKKKAASSIPAVGTNQSQSPVSGLQTPDIARSAKSERAGTNDIAVSVDGKILKKSDLEKNVQERIKMMKDKIPADKQKEFADKQKEIQENIRKQMVNWFIIKTILNNEFEKKQIQVNDEDIKETMRKVEAGLSPGKKAEDFLKENKVSREDVIFAIKVNKLNNMEIGEKAKPTQKEISKFYNENRDKLFTEPESVHVRHILVALARDDSEQVKAQKKAKIENLRKQLLNGANFAELAKNNSDCPSKEVGGDLSFIQRGQMAKPFEGAAFSQARNAIGPVIKTEFGYHIIQVLEHKPGRKVSLEKAKSKISAYLEQQKRKQAFDAMLRNLMEKEKIVVY